VRILKRELFVFFTLFILLSLSIHFKQWLSSPLEHIEALPTSPMGPWHPLVLTFVAYVVVTLVRITIYLINRLKAKRG